MSFANIEDFSAFVWKLSELFVYLQHRSIKEDAQSLEPYFDAGWNNEGGAGKEKDLYSCIISRFDKTADENKRISICIFVEDC